MLKSGDQVIRRKSERKAPGKHVRNWEYVGIDLGICHLFNWIYNLGGVREEMNRKKELLVAMREFKKLKKPLVEKD